MSGKKHRVPSGYSDPEPILESKTSSNPTLNSNSDHVDDMVQEPELTTTPLLDTYKGEEQGQSDAERKAPIHLPRRVAPDKKFVRTFYPEDKDHYRVGSEDGKLTDREGKTVSSAEKWEGGEQVDEGVRALWRGKDKDERHNFAMDASGGLFMSDPKKEVGASKRENPNGPGHIYDRSNHSSLVAGRDVAGAGTLKTRDGKVEEVGDGSGHYQPGTAQTWQATQKLSEMGVMDEERSSVSLVGKGDGQQSLLMSALEFNAYGPEHEAALAAYEQTGDKSALSAHEAAIREQHAKKDAVLQGVEGLGAKDGNHRPRRVARKEGTHTRIRGDRAGYQLPDLGEGYVSDVDTQKLLDKRKKR